MAAPVESELASDRDPIWLNPVGCGVMRVGVLAGLAEEDVAPELEAMPLYLIFSFPNLQP